MPKWKSQRIQYWRLQRNRLTTIFRIGILGFISIVSDVSAQSDASFPTIKETPIQRIHSLEISRINGLSDKALPEYLELLNFPETKQLADFRLAEIYLNSNELTKAELHAKAAWESDKNSSDFSYLLIQILEKELKYEEAWKIHSSLVSKEPRYISRYYDAINNCYKRSNYQDALNLIQLYRFHFGKNDYSHRTLIECWLRTSNGNQYVDSVIRENERYILTKPGEAKSWIAFQLRFINGNFPKDEAEKKSKIFVENLVSFQKSNPDFELDIKGLQADFPFLKTETATLDLVSLLKAIQEEPNPKIAELDFNAFQNQLQNINTSDSILNYLLNILPKNQTSYLNIELHVLIGNEFYKRGDFKNALTCYSMWKSNEGSAALIFETNNKIKTDLELQIQILNAAEGPASKSTNISSDTTIVKNDALSIHNRLIICKYKTNTLFTPKSNKNSNNSGSTNSNMGFTKESEEFEWYEINFPFLLNEMEILKDILWNQSNNNWTAAIGLWNSINVSTSIYPDFYFAILDAEMKSDNQLNYFKQYSFEIAVNKWVTEGKIHPKLAQELIQFKKR